MIPFKHPNSLTLLARPERSQPLSTSCQHVRPSSQTSAKEAARQDWAAAARDVPATKADLPRCLDRESRSSNLYVAVIFSLFRKILYLNTAILKHRHHFQILWFSAPNLQVTSVKRFRDNLINKTFLNNPL